MDKTKHTHNVEATCGYCRERFTMPYTAQLALSAGRPAVARCPWCTSVIQLHAPQNVTQAAA